MLHCGSVDWGAEHKNSHKARRWGRKAGELPQHQGRVGDQPDPGHARRFFSGGYSHVVSLCRRKVLGSARLSTTFRTTRVTASNTTEMSSQTRVASRNRAGATVLPIPAATATISAMSARCPYDSTGRVRSMRVSVFSRADWTVSGSKEKCPASSSLVGWLWRQDLVSGGRRTCHGATTGVQCGDQDLDRVECAVG